MKRKTIRLLPVESVRAVVLVRRCRLRAVASDEGGQPVDIARLLVARAIGRRPSAMGLVAAAIGWIARWIWLRRLLRVGLRSLRLVRLRVLRLVGLAAAITALVHRRMPAVLVALVE